MEQTQTTLVFYLNDALIDQLIDLYRNEFWCKNRSRPDVDNMLVNSDIVVGAVDNKNNLIGFVRVLTDFVYKATIFDLIVHPEWRKKNIGRELMDVIIQHPMLRKVEHFDLNCLPEMVPFYEKWDFTTRLDELGFMRRFNRNQ